MLQQLEIRNLVIVDRLSLEFAPGMSALTGETGAGKSILLDALGLALGERADRGLIQPGQAQAEVIAAFDLEDAPAARAWLEEQALESDGECILRRVLSRKGRSRAFINGRPVPLAQLAELGERLVEIHGQHEHQRLLRATEQRRLLDAWAGHETHCREVAATWSQWQSRAREFEALQQRAQDRTQRMDYLAFQLEELRQLASDADRLEALEQEHRRLAAADRLAEALAGLQALLEDDHQGVMAQQGRAAQEAERLSSDLLPELAPAAELLESARIQTEEALLLVRDQALALEPDPARLEQLDRRLGALHDAARKHRVRPRELPALLERLEAEYTTLTGLEDDLARLETQLAEAREHYLEAAAQLTRARRRAARALSDDISRRMQYLAMEGGRLEIEVEPLDESRAGPHGMDQVSYRVSTNPGQPPAPLNRVASGGELSRLSLAIQVATATLDETPTLIFDEVDVGIGGAVADTVGGLLCKLGTQRQVLCITHLPQVAARAHHQFKVEKRRREGATRTTVVPLDRDGRVQELARMVGGRRITAETLAHAEQMLDAPIQAEENA